MIGLALLVGVILGLRFRIGLVLTATVVVLTLSLGIQIREESEAAAALAMAALDASITEVVAFLVLVLKHAMVGRAGGGA